jgi:two-component system, LytTR family, response regulator
MIKCIIADDEPHAIELISSHISKIPSLELVYSSTNPVEVFQFIQKNTVDLIFLDIHMPELDGLQFLKLLGGKSKVILTTAYPEHALEGYEHDVVDYLLKPILFDRFLKAATKAANMIDPVQKNIPDGITADPQNDDFIFVKTETRGKLLKIQLSEINFIEGLGNYAAIHTDAAKTLCLITFKELEARLPPNNFIRIHKSFIIAVAKINIMEGNQVYIGKQVVPIGESYKPNLLQLLDPKIVSKHKGNSN